MIQDPTIHTYVCDFCGKEETAVKTRLHFTRDFTIFNGGLKRALLYFTAPDGWKKGRASLDVDICPMCAMKYPDACRDCEDTSQSHREAITPTRPKPKFHPEEKLD